MFFHLSKNSPFPKYATSLLGLIRNPAVLGRKPFLTSLFVRILTLQYPLILVEFTKYPNKSCGNTAWIFQKQVLYNKGTKLIEARMKAVWNAPNRRTDAESQRILAGTLGKLTGKEKAARRYFGKTIPRWRQWGYNQLAKRQRKLRTVISPVFF